MAKMKAPENSNGFSIGSKKYEVDKKGFCDVDLEDVENAKRHGFTVVVEAVDENEDPKPLRKSS